MATHYHIEYDGRLYLVEDAGTLRLPRVGEKLPFDVRELRRVPVEGETVVFAHPEIEAMPEDWLWKDDIHAMKHVDGLAKASVHKTMIRLVAKGAFVREGTGGRKEILLVKPRRGFFTGRWSLPGGYVDYGESPRDCVAREMKEELGVEVKVEGFVTMDSGVVDSGVHFVSVLYRGHVLASDFRLKEDEIAEARWFPLEEAVREVGGSLTGKGLQRLHETPAH